MSGIKHTVYWLVICFTLSVCTPKEEHSPRANDMDEVPIEVVLYETTGAIVSITPNKKMVMISHHEIPNFMMAMTMPFAVKDTSLLVGFQVKDSVKLLIEHRENDIVLKGLELLR